MEYTFADLPALLWSSAQGYHSDEAAVALLIGHGVWLRRPDFIRACITV
jgi:hypothetical protein